MPPYHFSLQQFQSHTSKPSQPVHTQIQYELSDAAKYNYQASYIDWCEANYLAEKDIIDPAEETICNYAASFMTKEAGGTVRAKIAAVKNLVTSKGFGWRGGIQLREGLNGVERAAPASSFRPERTPVKVEWLYLLHNELDNAG
ncbi:hypothetical protein EV368DRAFT_88587 [Lentinula lateritia]|nr:hypothetical protein EV368DRAFT_88587 [Lentinula lateritia]